MKFYITNRILTLLLIVIVSNTLFAQKDDIIRMRNGDKIIAEVKSMEYAQLRLSTDAMSTVYADWEKIIYLKSNKSFRIEEENGLFWFGSLNTDTTTNQLIVEIDSTQYFLDFKEVVRIIPIHDTFWDRLILRADLGFNFTNASETATLSFSGSAEYRTVKYLRALSLSSNNTAKKDNKTSQTQDLDFTFARFWKEHWFLSGFAGAQKNTELGLDLRLLVGSQFGKDFIRSNTLVLNAAAGGQFTREWKNDETIKTNLEAVFSSTFKKFQHHSPKIDWTSTVELYPNITSWGRIRYKFDNSLRWEIVNDLFWKFTFYDYYDSHPAQNSGKHDYGFIISFEWSKT